MIATVDEDREPECCETPVSELKFLEYVCSGCIKAMIDYDIDMSEDV